MQNWRRPYAMILFWQRWQTTENMYDAHEVGACPSILSEETRLSQGWEDQKEWVQTRFGGGIPTHWKDVQHKVHFVGELQIRLFNGSPQPNWTFLLDDYKWKQETMMIQYGIWGDSDGTRQGTASTKIFFAVMVGFSFVFHIQGGTPI